MRNIALPVTKETVMAIRTDTDRAGGQLVAERAGSSRRRNLTLLLLGSIIVSFLAASSAPTPLYALYARQWGFSPLAVTIVFGVYALAVLGGLLAFGRISDHVGRREQERAGVLSLLYIVSYLGMGLPAVIGGVLVTEVNGLLPTTREYGTAVIVLAVLALGGLLVHRPERAIGGSQPAPVTGATSRS
jgi:MFS family permease